MVNKNAEERSSYDFQIAVDITGFSFDPNIITEKLEITPHRALRKGEKNKELQLPRHNLWAIRTFPDNFHAYPDEHWDCVMSMFRGNEEYISELGMECSVNFTLLVDANLNVPGFRFDKKIINYISSLNAGLELEYLETIRGKSKL